MSMRAVAGLTAVMCAAAIVAASIGPFWRIRDVAIEGAHQRRGRHRRDDDRPSGGAVVHGERRSGAPSAF